MIVVLRELREGDHGRDVPVDVARVVRVGRMHEASTDDIQNVGVAGETGRAVLSLRRFTCRDFPGDDLSQVVDADGVLYNVVGEPKRFRGSSRTARDTVLLRQAGVVRSRGNYG